MDKYLSTLLPLENLREFNKADWNGFDENALQQEQPVLGCTNCCLGLVLLWSKLHSLHMHISAFSHQHSALLQKPSTSLFLP